MMKSEFITLLKENSYNSGVADEDYQIIEHVYNWHPAIKDKEHIVNLYLDYGMTIIRDMVARADNCCEIENKIQKHMLEIDKLRSQLRKISE